MRRRIRINNQTKYKTSQLRSIVIRTANFVLDNDQKPYLDVRFDPGRGSRYGPYCSGRASVGGSWMIIRLPNPEKIDKIDLVATIAHELGHNIGLKHRDMRGNAWWAVYPQKTREIYAWAEKLPLELKTPKVKAKPKGTQDKLEHVATKVKEWESKIKRAQTALKGWKRKEKYYAKRLRQL